MCQFYFGRNKIQYEHFNWQVIENAHFNIYYYPEEIQIAPSEYNCLRELILIWQEPKFQNLVFKK